MRFPIEEVLVRDDGDAAIGKVTNERRVIAAAQSRMRFARRSKIEIDADVNDDVVRAKPRTTACGELGRLRHFLETEDADVKRSRAVFAARGHRELEVIESR